MRTHTFTYYQAIYTTHDTAAIRRLCTTGDADSASHSIRLLPLFSLPFFSLPGLLRLPLLVYAQLRNELCAGLTALAFCLVGILFHTVTQGPMLAVLPPSPYRRAALQI